MVFSKLKQLGKLPLAAGAMLAAQASMAGTLTDVSIVPADDASSAATNYTFTYTLAQDVGADEALFYVTFPPDFTVDSMGTACDKLVSLALTPSPGVAICRAAYGSGNTIGFAVNTSLGGGVDVPAGTVVEVEISGITNPVAGGNYEFDAGSNTELMTTEPIDSMIPGPVVPKDVAPLQTVSIVAGPVDGSCGIAHMGTFAVAPPSETLCETGVEASFSENPTDYTWSCDSTNGGASANCSASLGFLITPGAATGGSFDCEPALVPYDGGTTCTATAATGYNFTGWGAGDCDGISSLECILNNVIADPVLEALFELKTYSVNASVSPSGSGSVVCNPTSVSHGGGSSCTATANAGYNFASWTGCSSATSSCNLTNITANKSVVARFSPTSHAITVNTVGSGTASCTPNPVNNNSSASCTAIAGSGYTFSGWSGACSGLTCSLSNVTSAKTVTATFTIATYTLTGTASPAAGGSVSCDPSVTHGSSGSCTATANMNYTFTGWSDCPSANENSCNFTNVTANQSVAANFTVGSYTVSPFAEPENAGVVECTSPVNYGSTATCSATANAGYRVKAWFMPDCTGASCSFSINAETQIVSITATAHFELIPTYNVTSSVSPADGGTITCTQNIIEGSSGTCTAKAKTGFNFVSWGGDCTGDNALCTLANVTANKTVSATFKAATTFNISASLQPIIGSASSIVVRDSKTTVISRNYVKCDNNPAVQGTTLSCSFVSDDLSITSDFRGWGGECSRVEGNRCIIENINSDKRLLVYGGISNTRRVTITPAGAGNLWCDVDLILVITSVLRNPAAALQQYCKGFANSGYEFESFSNPPRCAGAACPLAVVNFKPVVNTPSVLCENCNSSNTETDTTTTTTVSKTSDPDAQGDSTQTNVATTTNTQSGGTTTSVNVGTQNVGGTVLPGGSVSTNDPNAQVVVNGGSTSLQTSNLTIGTTSTAVVTTAGTTVNTVSTLTGLSTLQASAGLFVGIGQNSQGTSQTVANSVTGTNLGATSISANAISTISGNGSSLVRSTSQDNSSPTTTSYSTSTITTMTTIGRSAITTVQTTGPSVVAPTVSIASTQTASLISGAISGGFTSVGSGGFTPSGGSGGLGGGFGGGNLSVQVRAAGTFNPGNKPGLRKTAAEDDNAQAAIDITGGSLQSVQLYSDSIGLVEFFKPGTAAGSPQMTAFESTDESFSITLSYPAANE